jgi:hypothetical protein
MCASKNTPAVAANETAKYAVSRAANQPADRRRDKGPVRMPERASANSNPPDFWIIASLLFGDIRAPARPM